MPKYKNNKVNKAKNQVRENKQKWVIWKIFKLLEEVLTQQIKKINLEDN